MSTMKKTPKGSLIISLFGGLLLILLNAVSKNPEALRSIGIYTPTSYPNVPVYGDNEPPFYNPIGASAFEPMIHIKGLTTWRDNWAENEIYTPFLIDGDKLLFSGYWVKRNNIRNLDMYREENYELLCIDINSGRVLWQGFAQTPNLMIDEQHILYAPLARKFADGGLAAYDVNSGKRIWETYFPHGWNQVNDFFPMGSEIYVSVHLGHGSYSSYILDKATGAIKQSFEGEKRYIQDGVIISGSIVLKRKNYGYGPLQASHFGEKNGLWTFSEPVVSNIATDGTAVYFVTMNAQLVALDIQTGQVLERLQFSPEFDPNFFEQKRKNPNYISPFDFLNDAPSVAAGNGYVAVYFENKKQLSVFRFNRQ